MGRHTGSGRAFALVAAALGLGAVACQQPTVGTRVTAPAPSEGPRIAVEDALVDLHGHVVVTFTISQDDVPLPLADVLALQPRFTLATLGVHPVDGLPAWRSELLVGNAVNPAIPPSGPGTPSGLVQPNVRQPGSETPTATTLVDLGDGRLRYVFQTPLTAFDADETVRVGMYLRAAPTPSLRTSATYDFRPSGGPMQERETVGDANCALCHGGALVHHDGRAGVRLCETCHTWQNADPDTIDPAALVTAGVSAANNPNPLELGRMVHRIHRGRFLPTLYASSSRANPAPALAAGNDLPLPFTPENNVTLLVGRKYSIVGFQSAELIPGRIVQRTDNGQPAKALAQGTFFPRDLRDCAACHDRAPQAYLVKTGISRRTCGSCHPDVWFQASPATLDEGHLAHPGGPQPDDTLCVRCHVEAPPGWKLYAPIEKLHVPTDAPLPEGERYGRPTFEIVSVTSLTPGSRPTVTFRVADRNGPVGPTLSNPSPMWEPDSPTSSFVPRKFTTLVIRIAGATSPDFGPTTDHLLSSGVANGNPDPLAIVTAAASDEYVYTFSSIVPLGARGTWAVGMEGRRQLKYGHYDKTADLFLWPGTGETIRESPDNPVVYVDVASGTYAANDSHASPGATPRRKIVSEQKCNRCHGRIELHGRSRHNVEYCLFCHTPTTTDWVNRKKTAAGVVDLNQTYDRIEERSVQYKLLNHRIHTGGRSGSASLEAIAPFIVSGVFYDDARYPGDLRNCTACHVGKAYLPESVPADAPANVANETATIHHAANAANHPASDARTLPVAAACLGCHATGATYAHVALNTSGAVENCKQCHSTGALGVDVAHGLATLTSTVTSRFSSLVQQVFVPRCATTACHGAGANSPRLDAAGAYQGLLGPGGAGAPSSSPLPLVTPNDPSRSYLVHKLRGDAASVGGSVATQMPPDGALPAADIAAIEAWISNGAPND